MWANDNNNSDNNYKENNNDDNEYNNMIKIVKIIMMATTMIHFRAICSQHIYGILVVYPKWCRNYADD